MYPDYTIAYVEVVKANKPRLVILQPTPKSGTQYITNASGTGDPTMPTVTCEAQLQNYNGGEVTYKWMFSTADTFAQESSKEPRHQLAPRYSGASEACVQPSNKMAGWRKHKTI